MAGVIHSDARRSTRHPTGLAAIFGSTKPTVLLVLEPRIIHCISFEGRSTARSRGRGSVSVLHSCILVRRAWTLVTDGYLRQTALFRVWFLVVQQLENTSNYSSLFIPPSAYPFLHAAPSILHSISLMKGPPSIALSSITSIELGSWRAVIACDVDGLCRTIASLGPLRDLRLRHPAWASSGSNHSQLSVASPSHARLRQIDVWAEQNWLLDIRSVHFITWLVQSGTAGELMSIHFEGMVILDERLLAAVAAVVDESNGSLRELFLSVGPDLSICSRKSPWPSTIDLQAHQQLHSGATDLTV